MVWSKSLRCNGVPWTTLGVMILLAAPLLGQFDNRRLSELESLSGRVVDAVVTADGSRVVYRANPTQPGLFELFSVPSGGGAVTRLNQQIVAGGSVLDFVLSADGSQVLYRANGDDFDVVELYTVPVVGGTVLKVNGPMHASGEVRSMAFSPDGSRAVYVADQETPSQVNLYSVPLVGGSATQLSTLLPDVQVEDFAVSPDGSRVVYRSNERFALSLELFSVPLAGGAVTQLNEPLPSGRDVELFVLTADGHVLFSSESATSSQADLWRVPLDGGAAEQLNVDGVGNVRGPLLLSPSGSHLLFIADIGTASSELLSLNLATNNLSNLSGSTISVWTFEVTPDGTRVLFTVGTNAVTSTFSELRIAPIGGGPSTQLSPDFPSSSVRVRGVAMSPDSSRVAYLANADDRDFNELYAVPAGGGTVRKLNPTFTVGDGISALAFDSTGDRVIYQGDQDTAELPELYGVPWLGGVATRLNQELAVGGEVDGFVTFDGQVYFTAEGEALDVRELYRVAEGGGAVTKLSETPTATVGFAGRPFLNADETFAVFSVQSNGVWGIYSSDLTTPGPPILLNDPFEAGTRIQSFLIDPLGQRVVFEIRPVNNVGADELYSVPIVGGESVLLSDSTDGSVGQIVDITSDGQFVVYTSRIGGGSLNLFSVPMLGGEIQQLNDAASISRAGLTADGRVVLAEQSEIFVTAVRDGVPVQLTAGGAFNSNFALSPDDATVAFQDAVTGALASVPTAGGEPPQILNDDGGYPRFSPDGQRIAYLFSPGVLDNLFTIPAVGGTPVQLNDRSQHQGLVADFLISPDSSRTVMVMAQSNQKYLMASAPTVGGDMVVLEDVGSISVADGILSFAITPDSQQVIFLSNRASEVSSRVYSIDIDGGVARRLNPTGNVQEIELSGDGSRLYYAVIQPGVPNTTELRTVPTAAGGPALRMHPPLPPNREVRNLVATSDGQRILYISDQEADGVFHLYLSELNGALLQDGFESGNTQGWSTAVP